MESIATEVPKLAQYGLVGIVMLSLLLIGWIASQNAKEARESADRNSKEARETAERHVQVFKTQSDMMLNTINRNTDAMIESASAMSALKEALPRCGE